MAGSKVISQVEVLSASDVGRRRDWTDEDKVRIVEESLRGYRQGSATARRYGISRSLLTIWRREYRAGALGAPRTGGGFVPLVIEENPTMRSEVGVAPVAVGTIDIALTNGRRLVIGAGVDLAMLARLVQVLERA